MRSLGDWSSILRCSDCMVFVCGVVGARRALEVVGGGVFESNVEIGHVMNAGIVGCGLMAGSVVCGRVVEVWVVC